MLRSLPLRISLRSTFFVVGGNHQLLTNENVVWVFDCLSVGIVNFFPFVGVAVKLLSDSCERVAAFYGVGL